MTWVIVLLLHNLYVWTFFSALASVTKRCVLMHCPLLHNPYCCSLPSPMFMLHLLICTYLNSSPIACSPPSVSHWCLLCIWFNICFGNTVFTFYFFITFFGLVTRIGWIGDMNIFSGILSLVQLFSFIFHKLLLVTLVTFVIMVISFWSLLLFWMTINYKHTNSFSALVRTNLMRPADFLICYLSQSFCFDLF